MLRTRYEPADHKIEIGVDEAGRGSFWGPIMAGAVSLPAEETWTPEQRTLCQQIRDSKRISPKKRLALYHQILTQFPLHAVGRVDAAEINAEGIQWANREAFRRAVQGLKEKREQGEHREHREAREDEKHAAETEYRVIIDGMLSMAHEDEVLTDEQRLVIDGDDRYLAVAAASILAKVSHDLWIQAYCEEHPECEEKYDLVKSKGYGTPSHREGIQRYGGHELHRVVYIQYWLPGSTVTKQKRTKKSVPLDFNECLIQI
jgi:ribonuclease HII